LTAERIHAMVGSASREVPVDPIPESAAVVASVVRFAIPNETGHFQADRDESELPQVTRSRCPMSIPVNASTRC
jgi:hypothetical protein